MPQDVSFDVTLQDLRAIIHGLKMFSLSFVEEKALTEINSMIKALPSPETINTLRPGDVKSLQNNVGQIMRLIEIYGKRDMELKTRYKARTGLPPRYKVLDWRVNMEQKARDITRSMIKTSAAVDDLGYGDIADRFIKCAKKVEANEINEFELAKITADTLDRIGFTKEASSLRKVAQTMEIGMEDVTQGIEEIYKVVHNVMQAIQRKTDSVMNVPTAQKAVKLMGTLWGQLDQFRNALVKPVEQLKQEAPSIEQAQQGALPQSVFDAAEKKKYKIEWTDQDAAGEQTAYVTKADGQQYEVQRDNSGKMSVAPTPMSAAGTPAAEASPADAIPAGTPPETTGREEVPAGTGGGMTTSPDLSKITDPKIIDIIKKYLKAAKFNLKNIQYREALGVAAPPEIPKEMVPFLQSIRNDEAAKAKFLPLLEKRRQELGGVATAPAAGTPTAPAGATGATPSPANFTPNQEVYFDQKNGDQSSGVVVQQNPDGSVKVKTQQGRQVDFAPGDLRLEGSTSFNLKKYCQRKR